MTPGPGSKHRQRLRGEERRAGILEAALKLFAEKGFTGTRTKEIAREAGISETLIFQHFKNKRNLYRQALQSLFSRHPVVPEIEEMMSRNDDFEVFQTLATHILKHAREDRRILRLAIYCGLEGMRFIEEFPEDPGSEHQGPRHALSRYIRKRVNDGVFRDTNPQIAAKLFIDTVMMYSADRELQISGPPLPFSEKKVVNTLVDLFLNGLRT